MLEFRKIGLPKAFRGYYITETGEFLHLYKNVALKIIRDRFNEDYSEENKLKHIIEWKILHEEYEKKNKISQKIKASKEKTRQFKQISKNNLNIAISELNNKTDYTSVLKEIVNLKIDRENLKLVNSRLNTIQDNLNILNIQIERLNSLNNDNIKDVFRGIEDKPSCNNSLMTLNTTQPLNSSGDNKIL